jgi:P-type E1-E2 ATPase
VIRLEISGWEPVELAHLLVDVNGTLTRRGELLDGVPERTRELKRLIDVRLVSADTFGTLADVASTLDVEAVFAPDIASKLRLLEEVGASRTVYIGNGSNDAAALQHAVLGIAVLGPEGLSTAALAAADAVCLSAGDALEMLLDPRLLAATLHS